MTDQTPTNSPFVRSPPSDIPYWMAIHEAGHVVVADALGLTVTGVASDDDQIAVTTSPSPGFISATVSHAGGLAQHRFGEMPGHGTLTDLRHAVQVRPPNSETH